MLTQEIEQVLEKSSKQTKTLQFSMQIPNLDIEYSYPNTLANQYFHSASVGKLMTATLIFMAIEQGRLTLETKVKSVLKLGLLDALFVFKNIDYQDQITIEHILGHLSGINDYFESKAFDGSLFTDLIIKNPDQFWTPEDLIDYTRTQQKAIAKPELKFFYSDTGYVLLGLIIEAVFQMPFHKALETFIFQPAGLKNTSLCFYGDNFDQSLLAPLYINGIDIHLFKSLSCDFSGGGLATTAQDLSQYLKCFAEEKFISQRSIDLMANFKNRYRQGLYYGLGMMQVRFGEFFFLLKSLPHMQGHLGVSGVHAWYNPITKDNYILNVGNTKDMSKSFRIMIKILQLVEQEKRKLAASKFN